MGFNSGLKGLNIVCWMWAYGLFACLQYLHFLSPNHIISKQIVIISSNTTTSFIHKNSWLCLTELQRFVLSAQTQRDVLCKITIPVCGIIIGPFNKGKWEEEEDKKKNMKCTKLRQCACCCTVIHSGQKNYW